MPGDMVHLHAHVQRPLAEASTMCNTRIKELTVMIIGKWFSKAWQVDGHVLRHTNGGTFSYFALAVYYSLGVEELPQERKTLLRRYIKIL